MEEQTIEISHEQAVRLALSVYIGEKCSICNHEFNSVQDIKDKKVKCSGKDPMTFACGECFNKQNQILNY